MNPHEEHFARAFIVPLKRDRYLTLLESKRGRARLLNGFNHCHDLDPRYATLIPSNQQSDSSIESLLRRKGAPETCYVMSDNRDIDGHEMSLSDALAKTVGLGSGTFISCLPGKLGYFELEDLSERYILER
jgi:hypothetical protein